MRLDGLLVTGGLVYDETSGATGWHTLEGDPFDWLVEDPGTVTTDPILF